MFEHKRAVFTMLACASAMFGAPLAAETVGVTESAIKIGNTSPYSGPASAYGTIGKALQACFDKVNADGGINGRELDFVSLDDAYSPAKTVEQVRKLVEKEQVALLVANLGTPTNSAIHKYVNRKKVPHLFLATGAAKWGQPAEFPWTMGWQPSYPTEARVFATYIKNNVKDPRIAVLYQNDDYGKEYYRAFADAFGVDADKLIVLAEPYETSDPTVDSQIVKFAASEANVFFNVTTPKFASQAIRKSHDLGWKPLHFLNSVSASVGSVLEPAGLEKSVGIITANIIKDPTDPRFANDPDTKEWNAWMDRFYPEGDKTSAFNVYAYAVCNTLAHVLKVAGDDLSRENIMATAASIKGLEVPMLLPGIRIDTAADDFYPVEAMQLVRFNGKSYEQLGEVIDVGN
jgi:branched-chain amino acid transport system substrate-binding protein